MQLALYETFIFLASLGTLTLEPVLLIESTTFLEFTEAFETKK
jgi:hypothetical protein